MQSKFELNSFRKKKLREMLIALFPEYSLIRIKRNGIVLFGTKFFHIPIVKHRVHVSELCTDQIPIELGKRMCYRQYNHNCNIIDYLYQEYCNIKSSSKVDLLINEVQLSSQESTSDSITIKTILLQDRCNHNIKNIIKDLDRTCRPISRHNHHCERMTLTTQ